MRPLPRLHAITDAAVIAAPDFAVRAAAIAAAGSAVALHARDREASGAALVRVARRLAALARAAGGRGLRQRAARRGRPQGPKASSSARATSGPADARASFPRGWIGRSVHSAREAEAAAAEGADFLVVGNDLPDHLASRPARRRPRPGA